MPSIELQEATHKASRVFGVTQAIIFVLVVVTAILFRRRQRQMEKDVGANLMAPDIRSSIRRTPVPPSASSDPAKPFPEALESAFPSWTDKTPPHEMLGVPPDADDVAIEAAYKKLLKKFHPDRFASWGGGYQSRAHRVVLLIQDARSKLLSRRG